MCWLWSVLAEWLLNSPRQVPSSSSSSSSPYTPTNQTHHHQLCTQNSLCYKTSSPNPNNQHKKYSYAIKLEVVSYGNPVTRIDGSCSVGRISCSLDIKINFLKWGMAECVEKLNRLTTTIRTQDYFCRMI